MKVLLVAINAKYIHSNLAVYSLKKYAIEHKCNNDIQIEIAEYTINNLVPDIVQDIYKHAADVIVFSVYIWNVEYVLKIAESLARIMPETAIWAGGPEVSYRAGSFINDYPYFDMVMCGEGEKIFAESIQKYYEKNSTGKIVMCNETISMDELPFVYDNLSLFDNKIIYYESSRGCPFSCSYCLSSIDKKTRFKSLDKVKNELKHFIDNDIKLVKFVDRTFNAGHKHAMNIWQYIVCMDNGVTKYHFELAADILSDEEITFLNGVRPGLFQFEIGIQTFNERTLAEINRKSDLSRLCNNIRKLKQADNIHIHLDLIAGLPYEDLCSFKNSFNKVYSLCPDEFQLGFLKVLSGSAMEEKAGEYELLTTAYAPYEVLSTKWITYEDIIILKEVEEALEVYYNSRQFDAAMKYLVMFFDTSFDLYRELGKFMTSKKEVGSSHSRMKRYELLLEFAKCYTDNMDLFVNLLTYDAYLRENCKSRPVFAKKENDTTLKRCKEKKLSTKLYHFEKFDYDIKEYMREGRIINKCTEYMFDYGVRDKISYNVIPEELLDK